MTLEEFYGTDVIARMRAPFPPGFVSYRACIPFFAREARANRRLTPVGVPPATGVAWHHGPLKFEKYVGDVEPVASKEGPLRMCIWQRLTRTDKPQGWMRGTEGMGFRMTGHALPEASDPRGWSSHARRHLRHFQKIVASGGREIVEVGVDEYLAAYRHADQDALMRAAFPKIVRDKAKAHGERLRLFASRRPGGALDAGLVILDVPEADTSIHLTAFMAGAGKEDSASTGLVAHWFAHCDRAGITVRDFGFFWRPGDPKDWYGFSRFKVQFGVRLIWYPIPLFRFFGKPFWRR